MYKENYVGKVLFICLGLLIAFSGNLMCMYTGAVETRNPGPEAGERENLERINVTSDGKEGECPICLEKGCIFVNYPCQVPDGSHHSCIECFIRWRQLNHGRVICPICRHGAPDENSVEPGVVQRLILDRPYVFAFYLGQVFLWEMTRS